VLVDGKQALELPDLLWGILEAVDSGPDLVVEVHGIGGEADDRASHADGR
jgi:hypothetical protein